MNTHCGFISLQRSLTLSWVWRTKSHCEDLDHMMLHDVVKLWSNNLLHHHTFTPMMEMELVDITVFLYTFLVPNISKCICQFMAQILFTYTSERDSQLAFTGRQPLCDDHDENKWLPKYNYAIIFCTADRISSDNFVADRQTNFLYVVVTHKKLTPQ